MSRKRARDCGGLLAELAITLPLMLLFVSLLLDVGLYVLRTMQLKASVQHAGRTAYIASRHFWVGCDSGEDLVDWLDTYWFPSTVVGYYPEGQEPVSGKPVRLGEVCAMREEVVDLMPGMDASFDLLRIEIFQEGASCGFCFGSMLGILPKIRAVSVFPTPPDCSITKFDECTDVVPLPGGT